MTLRLKIILTLLITVTVLVIVFGTIKLVALISERLAPAQRTEQKQEESIPRADFFDVNTQPAEQQESSATLPQKQAQEPTPRAFEGSGVVPAKPAGRVTQAQTDLTTFALPFAERFGTYSNQSNFENLEDLLSFMTGTFKKTIKAQIETARSIKPPSLYKGVTTRALTSETIAMDEKSGSAVLSVTTQRKDIIGTQANVRTYQQVLRITFAKEDGAWLIANAVWE